MENGLASSFRMIQNIYLGMNSQQLDPGGVHKLATRQTQIRKFVSSNAQVLKRAGIT